MKYFVREQAPTIVVMFIATLAITSLAGGSETVFYLVACASLVVGLWWEDRKGRLG